jgi:hypothetical protein
VRNGARALRYKLYHYHLNDSEKNKEINPDRHFPLFDKSKGPDPYGELAEYRGKKDSVLMHVRNYGKDFIGLIGRHSVSREVTKYDERQDITHIIDEDDDDYPNTPFVCLPRLKMIACAEGGSIRADGAMSRLHQILATRQGVFFLFESMREKFDLRKAVERFRLTEVIFEILPVNPHSDDLGRSLDESRKLDHIKKILGTASASSSSPMKLNGGLLTAIQQLQQSGHCKVGFTGLSENDVEVKVPKPSKTTKLASDPQDSVPGEEVDVVINFKSAKRIEYPFPKSHVDQVRRIANQFVHDQLESSDED